jgi:hypothetical protein
MRGTVLFWRANEDGRRGFGFVAQEGCTRREENAWLGPAVLNGLVVQSGQRVEYEVEYFKTRGPRVTKIRLCEGNENNVNETTSPATGPQEDRSANRGSRPCQNFEREHVETLPGENDT